MEKVHKFYIKYNLTIFIVRLATLPRFHFLYEDPELTNDPALLLLSSELKQY